MKTGKSLVELAVELERRKTPGVVQDYVPDANMLTVTPDALLSLPGKVPMPINDVAHQQIANHLGIPKAYYDKLMADDTAFFAENVNHWLHKDDSQRMVRTLDGRVRAFLSDRYRPLDYADLADAVLPILGKLELEILSCEITEKRLYLKAVDKTITKDVPTGKKLGGGHTFFDTVSPGIVIGTSEVGWGALFVQSSIWTRFCTNLAVLKERSMRKYHIGGRVEANELYELFTDETRRLSDQAVFAQVRDVVQSAFDRVKFEATVEQIGGMAQRRIEGDPVKAIDVTAKRFGLAEGEKTSVLKHLIEGGDLTQYGVYAAVTRTAEDITDYDRATEFERLGGEIIELPKKDWTAIATAA